MSYFLRLRFVLLGLLLFAYGLFCMWVYFRGTAQTGLLPEPARRGARVWQKNQCDTCHQIFGLGGYMGPELTHVVSRRNGQYVNSVLTYGLATMPAFALTPAEREDLLAFLTAVDKSAEDIFPERGPVGTVRWKSP